MSATKAELMTAVKTAMKAKDKARLGTLRLIQAEIKQREVDSRKELEEADVIAILDKMLKQRRDSVDQFTKGGREDLAAIERAEIDIIVDFLPQQLSEDEVAELVEQAIKDTGASGMAGMGPVMNALRPQLAGKADMKQVSALVRARLTS